MIAQTVSHTRIPDLIVVADRQENDSPTYVKDIPFKGLSRLRFRVSLDPNALDVLEEHIKSCQEVRHVRINRLANSCAVSFEAKSSSDRDLDLWLSQLPSARELSLLSATLSQTTNGASPGKD